MNSQPMNAERLAHKMYMKIHSMLNVNLPPDRAAVLLDALRGEVEEILKTERDAVVKELVDRAFLLNDSPKKTAMLELARTIQARNEHRH